jgi:hypothetical protein
MSSRRRLTELLLLLLLWQLLCHSLKVTETIPSYVRENFGIAATNMIVGMTLSLNVKGMDDETQLSQTPKEQR